MTSLKISPEQRDNRVTSKRNPYLDPFAGTGGLVALKGGHT